MAAGKTRRKTANREGVRAKQMTKIASSKCERDGAEATFE
jgi:hypothetical protein